MAVTETKTFTITATISRHDGGSVDLTDVSLIDMLANIEEQCEVPCSNNFFQIISTVVVTQKLYFKEANMAKKKTSVGGGIVPMRDARLADKKTRKVYGNLFPKKKKK